MELEVKKNDEELWRFLLDQTLLHSFKFDYVIMDKCFLFIRLQDLDLVLCFFLGFLGYGQAKSICQQL